MQRSSTDADLNLDNPRAFEYLVEYPCKFQIKVIASNSDTAFTDELMVAIGTVCECEASSIEYSVRETSSGKYRSITLHAPVTSSDMLYKVYATIREDERVKFNF